jgi:hypothetical protein
VWASIAADLSGLAVFYWARSMPSDGSEAVTLLVDFDTRQPMSPRLFASIRDRLTAISAEGHAPPGVLFATDALARQARQATEGDVIAFAERGDMAGARRAELAARSDGDALLRERDALALAAAQAIGAGQVKVCQPAHEKAMTAALPLFAFAAGAAPDAATDAALIGLGVGAIDARSVSGRTVAARSRRRGVTSQGD